MRSARTIKVCVKVKAIAAIMTTPKKDQPAYIFCVVMYSAVDRDILLASSKKCVPAGIRQRATLTTASRRIDLNTVESLLSMI